MFEEEELILVLKEISNSFYISLYDGQGMVRSNNYYPKNPDIVNIRNLILTFPSAFGSYSRVIYMEEHKVIWDCKTSFDVFEKFLLELFASQYHSNAYDSSDFEYQSWNQFSEFLIGHNSSNEINNVCTITEDELPS